ncbi:galactosyltransferase-related protein [Pedobacter sp. MC2016-15]|uniref:galactosyltransferase-related protein n=1 Tax=Pedobacter sp. MC2016-15 TaxID=2994473 RepID=UPI00224840D8|nr:galactosyltransferase-related protein [Pedobacter sp. MC2016-15]MCX2480603.1 galactosyltransferase-related protein [Pedobacter sp. MC2016-15]
MGISILTLVKGREKAMENMINGLVRSSKLPDELIIILINEQLRRLPETPFPVRQIIMSTKMDLPLAAARNLAARHAAGSLLIFLDVDCIPATDLIAQYHAHQQEGILINGEVRYLSKDAASQPQMLDELDQLSEPDPVRSDMNQLPHELFWSLNFACTSEDYHVIGGFDEDYTGYGAEDTDFAFMARKAEIQMLKIPAIAYHQYHDSYSPPLNHFRDIVANARTFFSKWGTWPMEGWLYMFADMGLIRYDHQQLVIIREPQESEILQAKK